MTTMRLYDRWADSYDRDPNRTRDLARLVLRRTIAQPRGRVLEIGCGTGLDTSWLANRADALLGLDLSEGMLRRAMERGTRSRVLLVRHDVRTPWPLRARDVDLVVAMLVLEHVDRLEPVFAETARVLKPGGELFLCELHPSRQLAGVQARFTGEAGETVRIPAWLHRTSDYVEAGTAAGLRVIELGEWRDAADEAAAAPPRLLSLRLQLADVVGP